MSKTRVRDLLAVRNIQEIKRVSQGRNVLHDFVVDSISAPRELEVGKLFVIINHQRACSR